MNNQNQNQQLLNWIKGRFPQLETRMPSNPFFTDFGKYRMFSTHDLASPGGWLSSSGFPLFIKDPDVPDGFFACGIYSPAVSESLLVMWKEKERYFWLYDMYVLYIAKESDLSIAATRSNLDLAIDKWNRGNKYVVFLMGQFQEWDHIL